MDNKNTDLWPSELIAESTPSPVQLLKEQANLLSVKTKKFLIGYVASVDDKSGHATRSYGLGIKAPALNNYAFPVCKITYDLHRPYPLRIQSRQINSEPSNPKSAYWEKEVKDFHNYAENLAWLLSHETTIMAVRGLLAESKALGYDPESVDLPF